MRGGILESLPGRQRIGAVDLGEEEIRKIVHQTRDIPAGRIHFDRNRDGIAVVFNHEDDGQLFVGRRVQRLPEFALRSRALSDRYIDNLVALELDIAPLAVVALMIFRGLGMAGEVTAGLRAADSMQALRRRRRRRRNDMVRRAAPVRRHLPPTAGWICGRADPLQQQILNRDSQRQT